MRIVRCPFTILSLQFVKTVQSLGGCRMMLKAFRPRYKPSTAFKFNLWVITSARD